uniref:D-3-phosphoglycerate dehydrogenase n=2 Tax=Rhabditophanes sp. KR3021 TaxID=114890 RepID=A0AC35TL98_9BILA
MKLTMKMENVLIADEIEQECIDALKAEGINAVVKTKQTHDQLLELLPQFDAVIVRSATKITKELIVAGSKGKLKIVGRAGTGVDNIDVVAATEAGVVVMNTPNGNSQSAAELTCALVLSLARNITQADASMKSGKWARKDFMGEEIGGKVLAIIGLGRIGQMVASRMQAFGMEVIGFDPLVTEEAAKALDIQLLGLDQIYAKADYITVHVPLNKHTQNLINKEVLLKCKKGVRIINVARGGIINEVELVESIRNNHVKGAAFDVFEEEPPKFRDLVENGQVIAIPHLGASTKEAQVRVAVEIAKNIVAVNKTFELLGAINAKDIAKAC